MPDLILHLALHLTLHLTPRFRRYHYTMPLLWKTGDAVPPVIFQRTRGPLLGCHALHALSGRATPPGIHAGEGGARQPQSRRDG